MMDSSKCVLFTQVKGFNLRRWMGKNRKRVPPMLDAIAKLINGDRLRIAYTECDSSVMHLVAICTRRHWS